jgi:hypothetical protein
MALAVHIHAADVAPLGRIPEHGVEALMDLFPQRVVVGAQRRTVRRSAVSISFIACKEP